MATSESTAGRIKSFWLRLEELAKLRQDAEAEGETVNGMLRRYVREWKRPS